jgi:hypothetical protein
VVQLERCPNGQVEDRDATAGHGLGITGPAASLGRLSDEKHGQAQRDP